MTDTTATLNPQKTGLPLWPFVVVGLLLIMGWLGLKAWRINQSAQSLLARQSQIESLMAGGLMQIEPEAADELVTSIRRDIVTIKHESSFFLPLTPYLGWLPRVGSTVVMAPHLLEMADAGSEAAAFAMRGLKPALILFQDDSNSEDKLAELVHRLDEAKPDLIQTNLAVERLVAARNQIGNTAELPWRVRTLLTQLDETLPLAQDGLKLSLVLPEMAGIDGPRHYLILAQNEDELRATGGFISGAGLVVVENGRLISLNFQDANLIDNWQEKPYELLTSGPLFELMGLQLFFFRDANLWPDFPTSAENAMNLYSYGLDLPPLDGAIAIDQRFLQLLLEVTGPVTIPGEEITVNQQNIIANLRDAWAIDEGQAVGQWIAGRKDFLGPFAAALKTKLISDFAALDPVYLVRNMTRAIETGHLQVYMRDEEAAAVLAEMGWDGRLDPPAGRDYLFVLDTNVGYNKANANVERSLEYQLSLNADGSGLADLTVTYEHLAAVADPTCRATVYADEAPTYQQLTDQCFWNYLRIYAPDNSQLLEASQHPIPPEARVYNEIALYTPQTISEQAGFTTFTNYLLVPPGKPATSHYRYQLPATLVERHDEAYTYQLMVRKQAGSRPQPVVVTISLPPDMEFVSAVPEATIVDAATIQLSFILDANSLITVVYRGK